MIEAELINYGVLGIWTVYNIITIQYYRKKDEFKEENLKKVIENNTIALTKTYENMKYCQNQKKY